MWCGPVHRKPYTVRFDFLLDIDCEMRLEGSVVLSLFDKAKSDDENNKEIMKTYQVLKSRGLADGMLCY